MDIELARTFLEILRSGSFIAAAERLHVTQTTVTARIRNLESQLGCRLFVRNRAGATPTADGDRFAAYATQFVQLWDTAKRDLPLPSGHDKLLTIGGETALWNPLLLNWILWLRDHHADIALRAETAAASSLIVQLEHGILDAAVAHEPDYSPAFQVEQLLEEKLIHVRTSNRDGPYVYIDWGAAFRSQHEAALPGRARSALSMDFGPMALQYLLQRGGHGYFRTRVVQHYLESGQLLRVDDAPEFTYPIFLMYRRQDDSSLLRKAVSGLREVARHEADWSQRLDTASLSYRNADNP